MTKVWGEITTSTYPKQIDFHLDSVVTGIRFTTKSSATEELACDSAIQGHPLLCQSTRHILLPINTQW